MEKRFYIEKNNLVDDVITLLDDEHIHLSKVLRLKVGERVECFYNGSDIFCCEIAEITKIKTILKKLSSYSCKANPTLDVTLFQGLPKLDKLEFISQKLCEIGVNKIVPFSSKFCIAKENLNKIERLNKIIVGACKQCGRTKLLDITTPIKFNEMLNELNNYDIVLFANEQEDTLPLKDVLLGVKNDERIAVIVGSEGGFSADEISLLCKLSNVKSISLGKRILRTETASVVVCGCVMMLLEK